MSVTSPRHLVGAHAIDLRARTVAHDGVEVRLSWRHFEALALLIENEPAVVSKEQFFARLWPGHEVVDESNLTQCISQLRKALANGDGDARYIETVPRMGYRLIAPVSPIDAIAPPERADDRPVSLPENDLDASPASRDMRPWPRLWTAAALVVAGIVSGAMVAWQWPSRESAAAEVSPAAAARLRGEDLLRRGDGAGAVRELQQAVRLDPSDANAFAALAHALNKVSAVDSVARPAGRSPSVEAAERSVAIDPRCGGCQGTLGFYLFYHDWQWDRAEAHLREAIRLEPDTEGIRPSYALWLTAQGQFPAALEQIDFSLGKRPYEVGWLAIRASILYSARRYEEAIATADRALTIDDRARGPWEWRSKSLFQVGRGAEAVKALAQEAFAQHSAALDAAVHDGGGAGGLRALLNLTGDWRLRNEQSWRRIAWRALLDDDEGALDELDQAYALRNVNLMYAAVDPAYDRIRGHPRFQRVLSQMGLGANEYYEK